MKSLLFFLLVFMALTSSVSGLLLISRPDGSILQLSLALLQDTPFKSYLVPGILLAGMVGGANLLAVFYNLQRHPARYNWAIAGGSIMTGWIVVQFLLINTSHPLQLLYFFAGLLTVLIAWQLKGKWAV
jgi:hypothetical protein